jgi:hypothetical protein
MTGHRTVPVKVNAWVDEGIADLVSALSEIDGLITLESSQGDVGDGDAFVIFQYGDWRQCGELLFDHILPRLSSDLRADVSLKLQAYDTDTASARIAIEPRAVAAFTERVREILAAPVGASVGATFGGRREAAA